MTELGSTILERPFAAASVDVVTYTLESGIPYDHDKKIYVAADDPNQFLTANQIRSIVRRLVAGLNATGVKRGDTVLVHLFNHVIYPTLFHGIIGSGCCFMGSNPAHTAEELHHLMELVKPRIVITSENLLLTVQTATKMRGVSPVVYVLDTATVASSLHPAPNHERINSSANGSETQTLGDWHRFEDLVNRGEEDWMRITDKETAKATIAAIWSTSGTSGLPKAAASSHYALIVRDIVWQSNQKKPYDVVKLLSLPMFHGFAAGLMHIFPLREGETALTMPRFELNRYVEAISQYSVAETAIAPAIMTALNNSTLPLHRLLASLRCIWIGGGTLDAVALKLFYRRLPPEAVVLNLWGLTELGICTTFYAPERDATGSIGRALPGLEMRLVDDHGRTITTDSTPGEAVVKSLQGMSYYVGNPAATADIMSPDGWISTGDILIRVDGKYYVVDRKKDLIKVRGWQVAPAEIEAVLLAHPSIAEAAVTGVTILREDKCGAVEEAPRAFVVRKKGFTELDLTESDVYWYARQRLASYKALAGGVLFVESLPRTAMGKVRRAQLRSGKHGAPSRRYEP